MQMVHNLLLDAFRGVEVRNINLLGLDHVIVCTALDTETVNVSHYAIEYKPTGEKAPSAELLEMGPFMDLKIRRTQFAAPDLRKKAMLTPDVLKKGVNHNKNLTRDALGNLEGRIHVTQQEIEQAALAKMPALQKRNKEAFAEQVRSDEASKELLENKRKFVSDEMDVDEKPKKKSKK
jgi:ribosome production factor 2